MRTEDRWHEYARAKEDYIGDPAMEPLMRAQLWMACGFLLGSDMIGAAAAVEVVFQRQFPGAPFPKLPVGTPGS